MNIFNELDYRKIIRNSVRERRKMEPKFNFSKISAITHIQNTYLSKTLRGHADLNSDQLYAICKCLNFKTTERNYLFLLLEYSRCSLEERKQELLQEIQKVQTKNLRSDQHLLARPVSITAEGIQEYYLEPLNQIVHICLSIKRYQVDPNLLAKDLKVRTERVFQSIQTLERIGVIKREGNGFKSLISHIHLPKDSPIYPVWRNQLRNISQHRLNDSSSDQAYSFSVVFSADPKTRDQLHALFLDYLESIEAIVKHASEEQTYQMNYDLHSWTKD